MGHPERKTERDPLAVEPSLQALLETSFESDNGEDVLSASGTAPQEFDGRVRRAWRLERRRQTLEYWTPTLAAGLASALVALALVQAFWHEPAAVEPAAAVSAPMATEGLPAMPRLTEQSAR